MCPYNLVKHIKVNKYFFSNNDTIIEEWILLQEGMTLQYTIETISVSNYLSLNRNDTYHQLIGRSLLAET